MLVIEIQLHSAITGEISNLGTMVINNIGGTQSKGDYQCRMYSKGSIDKYGSAHHLVSTAKPIREANVIGHRRLAEPVHNLVSKALKAMEYQ